MEVGQPIRCFAEYRYTREYAIREYERFSSKEEERCQAGCPNQDLQGRASKQVPAS
jgi:hypothetical protein